MADIDRSLQQTRDTTLGRPKFCRQHWRCGLNGTANESVYFLGICTMPLMRRKR